MSLSSTAIIKLEVAPSRFAISTLLPPKMTKILAVFGATGKQGSSVINHVLNDPELSQKYRVRAITRDVNAEQAKQLKQKVEVVHGDVFNRASLGEALTGAHTIFAMTNPDFGPNGLENEYQRAKTIADVAVEKGVEYIIFSTLPSPSKISGGKYTKVIAFEAKAKAEQYIRGLKIKSAFFSPGSFMENLSSFMAPRRAPDGTWILTHHISPNAQAYWINAAEDTGKFIGAILAEPEKYEGKTFCAATALYSWKEIAAIMSKATGKSVVYKRISIEDSRKSMTLAGYPSTAVDNTLEALSYVEEFGKYGPDTKNLVAWAAENFRGKVSTLEEYFEAHPLQLK
jgi:uncharacterized protein YbjT (DUF2867 family)